MEMTMNAYERYAVFHAHEPMAMRYPQEQEAKWAINRPRYYAHAADVVAPLGQVFALTNHIDQPWSSNPEVVWYDTTRPQRSTSVGDVILSHLEGVAWLVMPIGLRPLWTDDVKETDKPYAPFGRWQIMDYAELWRRYTEQIPLLAKQVTLPGALPCRHPALSQLEGRYPVQDRLPPWWEDCIKALTRYCPCLEPLLRATSREEFRRGSLDQARWKAWRDTPSCRQSGAARRSIPCWQDAGPSLSRLIAAVLPGGERPVWLDRFVGRGAKDTPRELDLVITAHPAWWLNMANGHGWFSCMGSGPDRDLRLPGNWYDTGVALAALVERGGDCWVPGAFIARTTLRVVTDDPLGVGEQDGSFSGERPTQRVVLGRVYHNDHTAACTLLSIVVDLFEQHRLPWGCIAGTTTAEMLLDGSLGALDVAREPEQASGFPYWLPADIERPAIEGQVAYLERDEQKGTSSKGNWTFPAFGIHTCQRPMPSLLTRRNDLV